MANIYRGSLRKAILARLCRPTLGRGDERLQRVVVGNGNAACPGLPGVKRRPNRVTVFQPTADQRLKVANDRGGWFNRVA